MIQKLKKRLRDQRGMTLIELLAVIVILAIISAIAIPSILGLIDNSRKDAHVANAQQMINSAKLAVAGDEDLRPVGGTGKIDMYIPLDYLQSKGYLETIKDPDGSGAYPTGVSTYGYTVPGSGSYVKVTYVSADKYSYSVYLVGSKKSVQKAGAAVPESELKRSVVSP